MARPGVGNFKYYVGISSLTQIATREDRVCVLNILGGESSEVTPVGHAYSGGNVVFGTSPGRRGQVLKTPIGEIPVYNNVREGLDAGHRFNCGVVYLPPSAARDGVAELIRVNPDLEKIFIVTEKMSVHDAREIRAMGQHNHVDIFGGNSLGTVPTASALDQAVTRVTFQSAATLSVGAATNLPQSRIVNTWQAQDNWNYVVGKHTLKAGVNYTFQRSPNQFLPTIDGAFRYIALALAMNDIEPIADLAVGRTSAHIDMLGEYRVRIETLRVSRKRYVGRSLQGVIEHAGRRGRSVE